MLAALPGGLLAFAAIVLVFGTIVVVHEWGHMIAAKLCRVAVPDFAIGMGPSLASRWFRGTRYHICAVPIGGFVQIAGLTGDDPLNRSSAPQVSEQATYNGRYTKTWQDLNGWQKTFILINGVVMNFLLAIAVMIFQGMAVGFPANTAVAINAVAPGSPAAQAGIRPGDVVQSVNGQPITELTQFSQIVGAHPNEAISVKLLRGNEALELMATPQVIGGYNSEKPSLGVTLGLKTDMTNRIALVVLNSPASELGLKRGERVLAIDGKPITDGIEVFVALPGFDNQLRTVDEAGQVIPEGGGTPHVLTVESHQGAVREVKVPGHVNGGTLGILFTSRLEKLPPLPAIVRSLHDGREMMLAMVGSMKLMFTKAGADSITGPIGIFSVLGQSAQSDAYTFLMWVILINLNLAFVNLLPLPALDGGRIVFVALSGIGIRIPERREALVHAAGMLLLLAFMLLISIRDVGGILRGVLAR